MPDQPTGDAQSPDLPPRPPARDQPSPAQTPDLAAQDVPSAPPKPPSDQDLPALIKTATSQTRLRTFRIGLVVGALLTAALALLIVQNGDSVGLDWLAFDLKVPLWLLLLGSAVAGAVLQGLAATLWGRARAHNRQRKLAAKQLGDLVSGPGGPVA